MRVDGSMKYLVLFLNHLISTVKRTVASNNMRFVEESGGVFRAAIRKG